MHLNQGLAQLGKNLLVIIGAAKEATVNQWDKPAMSQADQLNQDDRRGNFYQESVAVTEAGRTARLLSALRPRARILAAASTPAVAARLAIMWGVTPFVSPPAPVDARRLLIDRGLVTGGSVVVFVSIGSALGRSDANFVHVETL